MCEAPQKYQAQSAFVYSVAVFYTAKYTYVTLDHKTSHKGQFFGQDTTIWKSGIWGCKNNQRWGCNNQSIEKITFKVVQINFLAMQINNKKVN